MKKRYFSILLVLAFFVGMMAGGVGFADNESVNVWINGERLNSSPGPQLIDGRVFVPLRAVSDSLGATVGWDAAEKTAYIASQGDALTDIEIVGDAAFKEAMTEALQLLRDKSPEDYKLIGQYCREIILDDNMRAPGTQGYNMEIHFPNNGATAETAWWSATLIHEATHIRDRYNVITIPNSEAEVAAMKKQIEVLKKLNAPQSMIDYCEQQIKNRWWEQSPNKNPLLEEILKQLN